MKIKLLLILLLPFIIAACQKNEVLKTHGIAYLDKREKLISINQSNKNDVVKILGHPSTKGMENDNLWIYIERTYTKAAAFKLGKDHLKKNNVLVLEFNKYGILEKKEFYNKNKMKKIEFAEAVTENELRKENFIVGFLSSIRQKMEANRK
tara:strand:+ start:166 stop:618 length:453 start_codon:yes stop_codon:yes gene_type:complete